MEEKSQSRDAVRQTKRASFFFLSPLSELVLANWPSLLDTHLVCSHTVESAQPGPGRAGISYLRRGQGRIIDQDPARGACVYCCVCVRRRCGRCLFGGHRRSLARSRARWLAKLASKGAETAHKVKIPPTRTRNQMVRVLVAAAAMALLPELLLERGRTRR